MSLQLVNAYQKNLNVNGRLFTVIVWTMPSPAGDWAALVVNGQNLVEVTGDALNRMTLAAQTLVTQLGGTP